MEEQTTNEVSFSLLCPVYNQADRLGESYERLKTVAEGLGERYEIIFVNDGSTDASLETIRQLAKRDGSIKYVDLSRRFGRPSAVMAGCDHAVGRAVIALDGGAVACLPQLVEKWQGGAEVVYTASRHPDGGLWRKICRAGATQADPAEAAGACLLDRKVVSAIRRLPERLRYRPGLSRWIGFKQAAVPCQADADEPRPDLGPTEGVGRASQLPVRIADWLGAAMLLAAVGYLVVAGVLDLLDLSTVLLSVVLLLTIGGVQLLCLAAIGKYVARVYEQTRIHPPYVVRYAHGFEGDQDVTTPQAPNRQPEEASRFNVLT